MPIGLGGIRKTAVALGNAAVPAYLSGRRISIANATRSMGRGAMTDRKSLSTYIAWLSTCLLAAAAGHLIDDYTRTTWLVLGTFGLVAAVGLQVASRTSKVREAEKLQRAAQLRMERQLGHPEGPDAADAEASESVKIGRPDSVSGGVAAPPHRE
jgi:hypothetical protein